MSDAEINYKIPIITCNSATPVCVSNLSFVQHFSLFVLNEHSNIMNKTNHCQKPMTTQRKANYQKTNSNQFFQSIRFFFDYLTPG